MARIFVNPVQLKTVPSVLLLTLRYAKFVTQLNSFKTENVKKVAKMELMELESLLL